MTDNNAATVVVTPIPDVISKEDARVLLSTPAYFERLRMLLDEVNPGTGPEITEAREIVDALLSRYESDMADAQGSLRQLSEVIDAQELTMKDMEANIAKRLAEVEANADDGLFNMYIGQALNAIIIANPAIGPTEAAEYALTTASKMMHIIAKMRQLVAPPV